MPTFEFFGYTNEQRDQIIEEITPALKQTSIADLITFLKKDNDGSKVVALDGSSRPFIRVATLMKKEQLK